MPLRCARPPGSNWLAGNAERPIRPPREPSGTLLTFWCVPANGYSRRPAPSDRLARRGAGSQKRGGNDRAGTGPKVGKQSKIVVNLAQQRRGLFEFLEPALALVTGIGQRSLHLLAAGTVTVTQVLLELAKLVAGFLGDPHAEVSDVTTYRGARLIPTFLQTAVTFLDDREPSHEECGYQRQGHRQRQLCQPGEQVEHHETHVCAQGDVHHGADTDSRASQCLISGERGRQISRDNGLRRIDDVHLTRRYVLSRLQRDAPAGVERELVVGLSFGSQPLAQPAGELVPVLRGVGVLDGVLSFGQHGLHALPQVKINV